MKPHVRGTVNCATTNLFFVNEKRLFRNGISFKFTYSKVYTKNFEKASDSDF